MVIRTEDPPPATRTHAPALRFALTGAGLATVLALVGAAWGLPPLASTVAILAFAATLTVTAILLHRHHPYERLGAANVVTLVRLAIVALLVALLISRSDAAIAIIAISSVALALDGVDGLLARRQHLESPFGARFDMEVDSAFALVLSVFAALGPAGPAALLLGLPRYLFGAAALALPWLNGPLPPRYSRKVVCVVQLLALIALQLPGLTTAAGLVLVGATVALLVWSFGLDIATLRRAGARERA